MWDVTFRTAVAQAELEDKERDGAYHRISFHRENDEKVWIETTRPELLPSCVALVAHPDDERYQPLFGTKVTSPLFGVEVEVKAHPLAQPDKGAGIAMICTFGDTTDVTWWRELQLPTRALIGREGRFSRETPEWITSAAGRERYERMAGTTVFTGQKTVVEMLVEAGEIIRAQRPAALLVAAALSVSTLATVPAATAVEQAPAAVVTDAVNPAANSQVVQNATMNWGLKKSFRDYLAKPAVGSRIETTNGLARNADGTFKWSAGTGTYQNGSGTINFPGTLHITGHHGKLDMTFTNVRLQLNGREGKLILDGSSLDMQGNNHVFKDTEFATVDTAR